MVTRSKQKKNSGIVAKVVAVGLASVVAVGCFGAGLAAAGSSGKASFESSGVSSSSVESSSAASALVQEVSDEPATSSLSKPASRDISQGVATIEAEQAAERQAAEEAARAEEQAHISAAQNARAKQLATDSSNAIAQLSEVDWSCGKTAFIDEWTLRINNYLSGSPLAGMGSVFAAAAWENGVDPRWSPAISNTESTKGSHCFLPHNAWGWGSTGWNSWEDAIWAHVAGLAKGYGYTISYSNAMKYCPPNYDNWFHNTLAEMARI